MHVHSDIAALRSNRAPQQQAQNAIEAASIAWRAEPGADQILTELDQFGDGAPLEACPQLEAVFTGQGEAERLIGLMSQHYCAAIAAHPYGHPPFRNGYDGTLGSMLLARAGRAQLILQSREPGTFEIPGHTFNDAVRFDAILGGSASARIVRLTSVHDGPEEFGAEFGAESLHLQKGDRIALDLATETLLIDSVDRRLVMLRLLRTNANPQPAREYDAVTGAFLHQSAGNLAISRQEATIALLGRMGRTDAAPHCAAVALADGDMSLRWQALRECLAMDTAAGFASLCQIARRDADPLAGSAGALRAQLLEAHPQLAQLEVTQCPA